MARRAGVIDVGSNTLHLLVAEYENGHVRPVHDLRVRAGLGAAVSAGGALGDKRIRELAREVRRFAGQARSQDADDLLLLATQAVRAADDRRAVVRALEAAARTPLHVLSPEGEAVLCLAGAGLEPLPPPPFLLADIGGGSCDLAAVVSSGVVCARSLPIGSGVLAARCLIGDPPEPAWLRGATAVIDAMLESVEFGEGSGFPEIVVTGGAGRRLRRQFGADTHAAHAELTERLLPFIERLLTEPADHWPHPLKDPERTAITRAGAVVLRSILLRWGITGWRISSFGLREGALRYHAMGHSLARLTAPGDTDRFAFEM